MSTQVLRGEEKIAVVLMGLAPAATESVLAQLGPHSGRLRAEISRLNASPPPQEVVEQVLHEFKDMLVTTAENATAWKPRIASGTSPVPDQVGSPPWSKNTSRSPEAAADAGASASRHPGSTVGVLDAATEPMDDPVAELRAIDADRLAAALTGEHPST
ncbi:MAG: hypothetical protein HY000_09075, partial [Planctomycetes bacterium]|nr:hypothetical protein [Planctomycetota bacterium]